MKQIGESIHFASVAETPVQWSTFYGERRMAVKPANIKICFGKSTAEHKPCAKKTKRAKTYNKDLQKMKTFEAMKTFSIYVFDCIAMK